MGRYYEKPGKQDAGGEYSFAAKDFSAYCKSILANLPRKWLEIYVRPILGAVTDLEKAIVYAESVYFPYGDEEGVREACTERMGFLVDAMRAYNHFEYLFEELCMHMDDVNNEGWRIAGIIKAAMEQENPEAGIRVHFEPDRMHYIAVNGTERTSLHFTAHKKEVLSGKASKCIEEIKKRYRMDKAKLQKPA